MTLLNRSHLALFVAALLLCISGAPFVAADDKDSDKNENRPELREPRDDRATGDFLPPDDAKAKERDRRREPMGDQEIEAARQIIAQLYPELSERLEQLYAEDPEKFRKTIERRFSRVRFLVKLQERDPALFALRMDDIRLGRETMALVKQVKQAYRDDDKAAYRKLYESLEEKLEAHFDVKQKLRQAELEALRQRVENLEEDLEDLEDERDDLIEQRMGELVGPEW